MQRWTKHIDAFLAVLVFVGAYAAATAHLSSLNDGRGAVFGVELLFGEAVMAASGRGFFSPDPAVCPELQAFLRNETDSFDPAGLPEHIPHRESAVAAYHRYLVYAAAACWRLFGISWRGLEPLAALLLGGTAAAAWGLMRLGMRRLLALPLTLLFVVSPTLLAMLPSLRDFGKTPFLLGVMWCLGMVLVRPLSFPKRIGLAVLMGVINGVGMGFRQDALVFVPVATAVLLLWRHERQPLSFAKRALSSAAYMTAFLVFAGPMLGRMEGGAQPYHPLVQGFSARHMDGAGLQPGAYDLLASGADNSTFAMLYDYAARMDPDRDVHIEYNCPGAEQAGRAWLLDVGVHFPADLLARGYATVLRALRYEDIQIPVGLFSPGWVQDAHGFYRPFAGHMHRFGPAYAAAVLLLISAVSLRSAFVLLIVSVYLCGYVSLQCEYRHAFHLTFVPFWLVGVLANAGISALLQWKRTGRAALVAVVPGACARMLIFAVAGAALLATPLMVLRAWQAHATAPLWESYARATLEPLPLSRRSQYGWTFFEVAADSDSPGEFVPDAARLRESDLYAMSTVLYYLFASMMRPDFQPWHTRGRLIAATFEGVPESAGILAVHETEGAWNDFSQWLPIFPAGAGDGPVTYFFPAYELLMPDPERVARNRFKGIAVPSRNAHLVKGLYEVTDLTPFRFLMHVVLREGDLAGPSHRRLVFRRTPAYSAQSGVDAVGMMEMAMAQDRAGKTDEARHAYQCALLLARDRPDLWLFLAQNLARLGDTAIAREAAHNLLDQAPELAAPAAVWLDEMDWTPEPPPDDAP